MKTKNMTTLEKIVKKAQALKKSYPKKFAKWTDYVKEASKEFRSTTTPAKKKSKLGAIPVGFQATFRGNPFYLTNQYDIFNNISLEVTDKKTNEVFAVIDKNSKTDLITDQFIIWLNSKGVNTDTERDLKSLHKEIKPLAVNLLQEVKAFNKGKKKAPIKTATKKKATKKQAPKKQITNLTASELIRKAVKKRKLIMPHGYEVRKSKLAGSKITPAEHYLSYAPPSKPSEQAIYKGIERVKQDILRLQAMQKDHMFKKHKSSINGAINTKNKEIKELLNKLK
jgi:hypothetical protein